jgi:hypothetical protein
VNPGTARQSKSLLTSFFLPSPALPPPLRVENEQIPGEFFGTYSQFVLKIHIFQFFDFTGLSKYKVFSVIVLVITMKLI